MLSGIGGGMVRDVLTAQVPVVLRSEIYAVAALAGAALVAGAPLLGLPPATTLLPGAALCVFLRMMAIYRGWNLPSARSRARGPVPDVDDAGTPPSRQAPASGDDWMPGP